MGQQTTSGSAFGTFLAAEAASRGTTESPYFCLVSVVCGAFIRFS